jgi:ABC-2 type transport system permease protein
MTAIYHPTVARLTYRALLGRRRALIMGALPALLLALAVLVRVQGGADDRAATAILSGFALAAMVPLVGVIAGTGAIAPEIDDGSVVYLLAKPVKRPTIIFTKFLVAAAITLAFTVIPVYAAGLILNGNSQQIATAFAVATAVAAVAYSAVFLLLGTISRNAVVIGLIYALVWEALLGRLVAGARNLSIQQWSLSFAEEIAAAGARVSSEVTLVAGTVLLVAVTAGALWYAGHRLRSLTLAGEH